MWAIPALGLVQGLAEFLPVSSSGHLVVLRALFGLHTAGAGLEVALHLGTLAAVVAAYRHWMGDWVVQLVRREQAAWRIFWHLGLASVPAGVTGVVLGHWVESYFTVAATSLGWAATAVLLWLIPTPQPADRPLDQMTWTQALWIGCAQALALWPGLSRSGTTIAMARTVRLAGADAAQFSFLMAIPAVLGATVFELPALAKSSLTPGSLALGALIAALAGFVAIQWITRIVNRPHAWRGFSAYLAVCAMAVWIFGG